jgi:hypothetical protein
MMKTLYITIVAAVLVAIGMLGLRKSLVSKKVDSLANPFPHDTPDAASFEDAQGQPLPTWEDLH